MEDYTEYIDAYFNRTMAPEQIKEFDRRIRENKEFADQVAFYLAARQSLKEQLIGEKKEWFRQLASKVADGESEQGSPVRQLWIYRAAAAATVVVALAVGWYLFFGKTSSSQQLADNYIKENLTTLSVTMSSTPDTIQNGLRLYNEGRYDSAAKQFERVIERDTGNYLAKEYAGIVYLRLANYDTALAYFQQLEKYSLFSNPAIFYQALTLLKRNYPGDKQQARRLLEQVVDKDLEGKQTAQHWLNKW